MNKELSPLEALRDLKINGWFDDRGRNDLDIIETALKRLEDLETSENEWVKHNKEQVKLIRKLDTKILENEKKLKALEIIKEKNVDVDFIKYCFQEFNDEIGLEQYNIRHIECSNNGKEMTQEEYDLLKEVLL